MRRTLFILTGAMVVAFSAILSSTSVRGQAKDAAPDVSGLIKHDADYIRESLKDSPSRKALNRVKLAAFLVAGYAQNNMGKDEGQMKKMATLRDKALDLVKAVDDNKLDDARMLAKELGPDIKAGAAMTKPVDLNKKMDFEAVMRAFSSTRVGGFGLERDLDELAELKDAPDAAAAAKIQTLAQKSGQIAKLAMSYGPATDKGLMTKAAWKGFCEEMGQASAALTAASQTKQADAIATAARKLSTACVNCHDIFR